MHTITGFSGRDCVLIILLQLHDSNAGLFKGNSKFQNACLQGYLFSQKLNKDRPL